MRDSSVTFRLPSDLKEALERRAEDEGRSVSNLLEKWVRENLKKPPRK